MRKWERQTKKNREEESEGEEAWQVRGREERICKKEKEKKRKNYSNDLQWFFYKKVLCPNMKSWYKMTWRLFLVGDAFWEEGRWVGRESCVYAGCGRIGWGEIFLSSLYLSFFFFFFSPYIFFFFSKSEFGGVFFYALSPRILLASWMSLGIIVTLLAWMAHRLVSSKRPTK